MQGERLQWKVYHCTIKSLWLVEAQGFTPVIGGFHPSASPITHPTGLWSVIKLPCPFQPRCGSPQSPQGRLLYQNTKEALLLSLSLSLKSIWLFLSSYQVFSHSWAEPMIISPLPSPANKRLLGNGKCKRVVHPKMCILSLFTLLSFPTCMTLPVCFFHTFYADENMAVMIEFKSSQ